jgi:N-acetylneuraminate synthase
MIEHLRDVYQEYVIGYSDHVPPDDGMVTLLNAAVHGADIIEKHYTLDKTLEGNDHYHAMDPDDVRTFREHTVRMSTTTGTSQKRPIKAESESRKHARRSLVAIKDIEQGQEITRDHVAIKRPGTGIPPTMIDIVVGRTARANISRDEILDWKKI